MSRSAGRHSLRTLDLRGLDPLQLGQRVLQAIETLGADEILEILTDREPLPLRNEVAQRGFRLSSKADRGGFVTISTTTAQGPDRP